jgi:hypothetical protein
MHMNHLLLPGETIIENKKCLLSGESFYITESDFLFYDKMSPVFNGQKYSIPTPSLAPKTRMQRRIAFRNERFFYEKESCFT